ncbi:hypothetical protein [Natronococcus sp. A-GB7]|uniref:hypothetical protein n=1 Tax=Natronococcus sp. A-GB7 TaxID=3037649 RepID=UPI00241DF3BC|nr:hypothetical protein [Natronococcus sp. A-GB7]MDG5819710.1 hypothetical protein [Natronococcus sp. A-GB7]
MSDLHPLGRENEFRERRASRGYPAALRFGVDLREGAFIVHALIESGAEGVAAVRRVRRSPDSGNGYLTHTDP